MTEDVSATMRLVVTICIVAQLTAAVLNLTMIGNNLLSGFVDKYVQATHTAESSVVASLKYVDSIGAATA